MKVARGNEKAFKNPTQRSGSNKWARPLAGAASGIVEMVVLMPLDVLKTRAQLGMRGNSILGSSLLGLKMRIIRHEGPLALYKGLIPLCTQQSLKYGTRHGMFQFTKNLIWKNDGLRPTPAFVNILAGLSAGVIESFIITTPFEVVKTRLQQQKGFESNSKYRGTIQAASTIIRTEGVFALWNGVLPTMIRGGSNQACNFLAVSTINQHIWGRREGDGKQLAIWKTMLTGFISGCIGPTLNNPLDVAKTRLMAQTNRNSKVHPKKRGGRTFQHNLVLARGLSGCSSGAKPHYAGMFDCMRQISQNEGVFALWNGLTPRLIRTGLGQAISWTIITRAMVSLEASSNLPPIPQVSTLTQKEKRKNTTWLLR